MNSTGNPAVLANAKDFVIQDANFINAQTVNIGAEVGFGRLLGSEHNNMDPENNSLPSRPKLFVGRESLVAEITSTLISSNHAALVGTGGIGKSYIASAILHEHNIMMKFKHHRYFIRYDNVSPLALNFQTFLDRIVGTLGVIARPGADRRDAVLQHLRNVKNDTLLVLDNAETFLDSKHDLKPIGDFVVELGDMKSVSLMFTSRTMAIPPLVGCVTFNIPGLEQTPAQEAFMSIYRSDISPESVDKLLSAVEFHPLSITLLAHAGAINKWSPKLLEDAWERESALVLEKSRAVGFGITVEVSLKSPSIAKLGENVRMFLHVVAFLPQGVHHEKLKQIFPSVTNIHDISDTTCIHSLTYRNGNFITMLAPIRLYILHYYAKEVARDTSFDSMVRAYYRDSLLETAWDDKWIVDENANIERLVALDLETPKERGVLACIVFMGLTLRYNCRPVNLESLVLALPEDGTKLFRRILRSFTRPGLIRLFQPQVTRGKTLRKAECLLALALINDESGSVSAGIRLLDQGGRLFLSQNEWARGILCHLLQTSMLQHCGKYLEANTILKQANALSRKFGDSEWQAWADFFTGSLLIFRGDPEGVSLCQGADNAFEKPGCESSRTVSLAALGNSSLRLLRDSSSAEKYYNALIKLPNLDHMDELEAKMGLISVAFAKEEVERALQMRDELALIHPVIEHANISVCSQLADWETDEGRFTDARDRIRALNLLQEKLNVMWLHAKFSEARVELFDRCFSKARELLIDLTDICGEWIQFKIEIFRALGEIAILENDYGMATTYFSQVKEYCDENGVNPHIFGGDKFYNRLTNALTQKDIFRGWPEFLAREECR